jgi:endogenous inhibitor of DNA gyrase (YacG/DUF329 family)
VRKGTIMKTDDLTEDQKVSVPCPSCGAQV